MLIRRGTSRAYLYRNVQVNGRRRRVYVAKGDAAVAAHEELQRRLAAERAARDAARRDDERHAEALGPLAALTAALGLLTRAALEKAGFRLHCRGEWRLTRGRTEAG